MKKVLAGVVALAAAGAASAQTFTLPANPTANNGGAAGWAIFFNLSAGTNPLTVKSLKSASTAAANAGFSVEVFTRSGTALGGPVGSGPGSSPAGWTSLGVAAATQGPVGSGISLDIDIPDFGIAAGDTVGVALLFTGAGPRYFGTGTAPLQSFTDGELTLLTGDARSVPFTTGGSFFSSRGLVGDITYEVVPAPSALALLGLGGLVATRRRR